MIDKSFILTNLTGGKSAKESNEQLKKETIQSDNVPPPHKQEEIDPDFESEISEIPDELTLQAKKQPNTTIITKPLGQQLVDKGVISADQLEIALQIQRKQQGKKQMLGAILVDMGVISESALGAVLSETAGIQTFDLNSSVIDTKLISRVPKEVAIRHKLLTVAQKDETIYVATADVYNILAMDQLHRYFPPHYKMVPVYSPESSIMDAIDHYYKYEMSIDGILKEIEEGEKAKQDFSGEDDGYVNPMVRLVDALLVDAIKQGASDIHFEPESFFIRVRYRLDGKMMQIRSFHKDYWSAISVRIKIMSHMNIAETRIPQDGRITYNVLGREIDFRVATQPTIHGENIVMRILDKKHSLLEISQLGYNERNERTLRRMIRRPEGIIIITGPTGSGKTTTLYSVLKHINNMDVNIMTLEDPVEYQIPLIRQSQVRSDGVGMDFAEGIRSMMRQDPDIIFIGEIRDKDTANMAVRSAMTGHQVYTTLHTNDAVGAIPRLVDIGIDPHLLSGSLIGVIAQRLVRVLCPKCKETCTPNDEECNILNIDPLQERPTIYKHAGCDACHHTGYKGRVAISEILQVDKEMDELIATGATRRTIEDHARELGYVTMLDDGVDKVLEGITDVEELASTVDVTERI